MMAEDRHITRRGVRAMMRPKPRRVTERDPFRPLIQGTKSDGSPYDELTQEERSQIIAARQLGGNYAATELRILARMRCLGKSFDLSYLYGGN